MKISGGESPRNTRATRGAKSRSTAPFSPSARGGEGAGARATAGAALGAGDASLGEAGAATLSALIALQSHSGLTAAERRGAQLTRARRALDLLDAVRDGLLAGQVSRCDLIALSDVAVAKDAGVRRDAKDGAASDPSEDAALDAIWRDIALRARVELAKLEAAEAAQTSDR